MLVVDMVMLVCFEVAAPNREGPNGNDNGSQITSWMMIVIPSFIVAGVGDENQVRSRCLSKS